MMNALRDKTLIIGPSWVGDMVMAQSLFKAIKLKYPDTLIDVLAPEWSRPLTERMSEVHASIAMPVKHGELALKTRFSLGKKLAREHYQRCFVLPNSFKSALIPFWAKIPERIGWKRECRYFLLNRLYTLDKKRLPRMVQRYVALVHKKNAPLESIIPPTLTPNLQNRVEALKKYHLVVKDAPILILCPGAEFGPSKRWPEKNYAQVANHYLDQNWQVWIFGSAKDSEVAQSIQQLTHQRCIDLTGRTSLGDAIDLMSLAQLVISNDSGLMHIAAALGRSLIAIYGSTDPGFTPPLTDKVIIVQEKIACSPCFKRICPLTHHDCMQKLTVQKVLDATQSMMSQS